MAKKATKSITIYQKTYQLPVLENDSFQKIQDQIQQRQQIIKKQERVVIKQKQIEKKSFFGLRSQTEIVQFKTTQKLTFEDKFQELERLVKDYHTLIYFLTEHKQVYQHFFAQLTNDLKQVVQQKLKEAEQQERERIALLKEEKEPELINILTNQKEQILANVWLFGKAFLLMLKKIKLISEGIERITSDQDKQKDLLIKMVEKLGNYKKVYNLQRKITQSGKEAEQMADTAINLEQYLQPFIGSFQGLIDQVCEQDSHLNGTVNEILFLVADIMYSKTENFMSARADDLSKNMLDFLITNEEKKARLAMAIDEAQQQGIDWSWQQIDVHDCGDLTQAITALQSHIDDKLGEYSSISELSSKSPYQNGIKNQKLPFQRRVGGINKLESEKNIDYRKLETLLSEEKWQEADEETSRLMLKAMNKNAWDSVDKQDLLNFPVTDLRTMDRLWLNYSDGKFGFSVQKQIWIDCGGTIGKYDYEVACKFADKIGWRKNGSWLSYSQLTFNTNAPTAHLPASVGDIVWEGIVLGVWTVVRRVVSLFSPLDYNI